MSVYLSDGELQQFQDNGITQDDIKNTVDYYRNEGLSDEEIRAKVDTKLKSFNPQKNAEMPQDNSLEDGREPLTPQNGMITGGVTFDWDKAKEDIKTNPQETGLKMLAESRRKDPILQGLKGGLQSISAPFVGIGKSFTNKVLRPLVGKKPLTDEELDNAYGWVDDKPQGMGKVSALGTDLAIAFGLPEIKAFQGAGLGAKIGNSVLTNAYQGGLIGGVEDLRQGGNGFGGATIGALGGGALGTAMPLTGAGINKMITSPKFQKGLSGALEILTSVPQKYSLRALGAELAGKSLFKGKFDPDTAYRPIEERLREAKNLLPTKEDFAESYRRLGDKAQEGIENLKNKYGSILGEAMEKAGKTVPDDTPLLNDISKYIDRNGAKYNTFKATAPRTVNFVENNLSKDGLTYNDLHEIKNDLYDMGYTGGEDKTGTAGEFARGVAGRINNYLRANIPNYKEPNEALSYIHDVERGVGGNTTLANQIENYADENQIKSGLDERLKNLDNLLPQENKFLKEAQKIRNSQENINNINKLIGRKYERNPRLLSNYKDEATEQALEDLQKITGTNFMDKLEDIRARETLEKIAPGQGGGSGNDQGFMNNFVRPTLNALPRAASSAYLGNTFGGPIGGAIGLLSVSPKFMGKGTIKNIGAIYNGLDKIPSDTILKLLYGATLPFNDD